MGAERDCERALRASEERLRAVFIHAAVGIAVTARDGSFREANPKFCDILGYSLEELRRMTVLQITHAGDAEATRTEIQRLLKGDADHYALEKRYLRKDGSIVWGSTRVSILRQATGRPEQFIGVVEDITALKQTGQLQSRLAAVIESSDDAIITKTLEGIILTWNPGAQRIFGYAAHEVVGKPVTVLMPPDHVNEEPAILERLRRGERIEHYETVRMRKDGERIDISLTISPIQDGLGRIVGASKIARDITRQKRAEEALREQGRVLELLDAAGRVIASKLDLHAVLQTVTDIATAVTGAKYGAFFYNVINERGEAYRLYALSGAPREAFEHFGMPRNTPVFQPTFAESSVVRAADITQDSRYGRTEPHRGMPEGHLPVKSYLAAPVRLRSGEVAGGLIFGHPEPAVFTARSEQLVVGIAAQAAIAIENARLYEAGQLEIARRERAEASLRAADRRKDEFLATLAHELRNPLAPIRQAVSIAQSELATPDQRRWSHGVIDRQIRHMSLLLDDLLDISRITHGTLQLRTEQIELSAITRAAIETARPLIDRKHHSLTVDLPPAPVRLWADPVRLAQVLSNLLTNSAKYTDPGGNISLRARSADEEVSIEVSDTGIGIPPEALGDIFTMFSLVRTTGERSDGGLGIGLALSKGIVELHGGRIEARSEGPRRGSTFTVRLPNHPPQCAGEPSRAAPACSTGIRPRRVLIADDNRDAAETLAVLLEMRSHTVTLAHDGREALEGFNAFMPDVVVLDIGMPGLNGYEVARQIRSQSVGQTVTLIALTGWGQESDKARARAAGFNYHFTKPLPPEELVAIVARD